MHFLQSPEWEKFQQSLGREVWRVEGLLVVKLPLIFGKSYLYSAGNADIRRGMDLIKALAKKENAIFLKVESMQESEFGEKGFRKSGKSLQPQKTIMLSVGKSEEELLGDMHQKTRYNIRLAGKHNLRMADLGLRVDDVDFERFWKLLQKTSQRDTFHTHPKEYYRKLLKMPTTKLFGVEHEGKIVAVSVVLFYENRATYLHGASDWDCRNLMAPYFLHWETIKYAKENGFKLYDLWGIDEGKWPGVTKFKKGFGGKEIEYDGTYDYIFQPLWYKLYQVRSWIKKY